MSIQLKLIEIQCVFHRPFRLMQSLREQLSPTHHSAQPPILQADALTPGQRQEQTQNSEVKSRVLTDTCKQVWSRLSQRSRLGVCAQGIWAASSDWGRSIGASAQFARHTVRSAACESGCERSKCLLDCLLAGLLACLFAGLLPTTSRSRGRKYWQAPDFKIKWSANHNNTGGRQKQKYNLRCCQKYNGAPPTIILAGAKVKNTIGAVAKNIILRRTQKYCRS